MKEQLIRIQQKLVQAKAADKDLEVFGASSHKYHLNPPVSEAEILAFEQKYELTLPEGYRDFLLTIGDKNAERLERIAGPYYGLFDFDRAQEQFLLGEGTPYLKAPCALSPDMTDEEWDAFSRELLEAEIAEQEAEVNNTEFLLDEATYEALHGKVYSGLLPLGSQGCSMYHALVLNGKYAGRVVNIDVDLRKPKFAFETTFLDWYERYLDEVISGDLIGNTLACFGYNRRGTIEVLLNDYQQTTDLQEQRNCRDALWHKKFPFPAETFPTIEKIISWNKEDKHFFINLLLRSSYEHAKPYLNTLIKEDFKKAVEMICFYAKKHYADWVEAVKAQIPTIEDLDVFKRASSIISDCPNSNFEPVIVPFTHHPIVQMREYAYYTLSKSPNREGFLEVFINGLQDTDNNVLRAAIQALSGITDERLLPYYKQIAKRFPEEKDYILSNLERRLASFGLTIEAARK